MTENKLKSEKKGIFVTLRDKKYELLFNFFVMIIGILVGFQIEGRIKQNSLNNNTRTKLHFMYLESQYNVTVGKSIFEVSSDTTRQTININKLDDIAAKAVFHDENIFNILQPYKFSLVRSYIEGIQTLNAANEKYMNYIESINYGNNLKAEKLKNFVRKNSSAFLATCYVLQQEFESYFNTNEYDRRKIKEVELEIKKAKENVLQGKFKLEK